MVEIAWIDVHGLESLRRRRKIETGIPLRLLQGMFSRSPLELFPARLVGPLERDHLVDVMDCARFRIEEHNR